MNQEIWLMRHGAYHGRSGSLTDDGIACVQQAARVFQGHALTLYHSPVKRCVETATILRNHVTGAQMHEIAWLGESAGLPSEALAQLPGERIVVVSHQPTLCAIARQLSDQFDYFNFRCGLPLKLVFR